ncbi:hypothetical protein ACWEIK_22255 [Streptomyces sp. NPDC004673]
MPKRDQHATSTLARRVEAVTGHDLEALRAFRGHGILDEALAHLIDQHRALAESSNWPMPPRRTATPPSE